MKFEDTYRFHSRSDGNRQYFELEVLEGEVWIIYWMDFGSAWSIRKVSKADKTWWEGVGEELIYHCAYPTYEEAKIALDKYLDEHT